ncbi:multicopper oxidase domain-containing protein [Paraburkholderia sp. GAS448]|uniref:multicopper oxidase domain-containing protein n=1 Tax=Paraburkholderia sp. GAS448 TaxID=3035136 RepID=UPI003D20882B
MIAIGVSLAVGNVRAAVPGITGGTTTPAFNLVASAGTTSQPDGASIYTWGYGCGKAGTSVGQIARAAPAGFTPAALAAISTCPVMQLPGPTLIVKEGDTVTVNLTNELPVAAGNTSIIFPGFKVAATQGVAGVLTREASRGQTVTYSFVATKPGTYVYHSGTQAELQIEMGLYGALIVLPKTPPAACQTSALGSQTDYRLSTAAYNHPQSCYDREYLFQLTEMDSNIHAAALQQVKTCDAAIAANANAQCLPIAVQTEPYHPNYFLVNGRSMPDDMDAPFAPNYPSQPYNGNPHLHPGETMLIRTVGQGRIQHPLHIHGNHARVLARDGNLLVSTVDQTSLAGPLIFTFPTVSGQTVDALFQWTGKGLNWDVYGHTYAGAPAGPSTIGNGDPQPCYPDTTGYFTSSSNPAAIPAVTPNYGEWCADHNKPIPVTPPDLNIVTDGLWYGGTPYLGLQTIPSGGAQFISTPRPPGFASQNPSAGYAYMWHSHDEREITTNDVFPGGMMMMLIVDPPAAKIDETQ